MSRELDSNGWLIDPESGERDLRTHIAAVLELLRPVTPLEAADAAIEAMKEFYEDSLQSTAFSAMRLLEQHSTPKHPQPGIQPF